MRPVILPVTLWVAAAMALAACAPPQEARFASTPVPASAMPDPARLTPAAEATLARLRQAAASGDYREMATLASLNPDFRSNDAGWTHSAWWYLKLRTGDWPTRHLERVLAYRHGVRHTPDGRVFVWPYMAALEPGDITPAAARDMDELAGVGEARRMKAGDRWSGYSLGVREDGTWLWFSAGVDEIPDASVSLEELPAEG